MGLSPAHEKLQTPEQSPPAKVALGVLEETFRNLKNYLQFTIVQIFGSPNLTKCRGAVSALSAWFWG